jgi:phospholipid N-methyltransferase
MWETSKYWKSRAAGAIAAAKYKERPDVRARRIKGLEADRRKQDKYKQEAEMWLKLWTDCENEPDKELQKGVALRLAGMCHLRLPRKEGDKPDFDQCPDVYSALNNSYPNLYAPRALDEVFPVAQATYPRWIAHCERWIRHYENRLEYERAMLAESGGLAADRFQIEVGGRVLIGNEWSPVLKINKSAGKIVSVSVTRRYLGVWPTGIEEIKDYRPPSAEDAAKVKAVMQKPPLVNFRAPDCVEMTMAEWKQKTKWSDSSFAATFDANGRHTYGRPSQGETAIAYRQRSVSGRDWARIPVFITDAKEVKPPAAPVVPAPETPAAVKSEFVTPPESKTYTPPEPTKFDALKDTLKQGIHVVSAPQLFPTPRDLAARMVDMADIQPGETVLEPSAGTGAICRAVQAARPNADLFMVEVNGKLAESLSQRFTPAADAAQGICRNVLQADFLTCNGNLGTFDVILMNPPFVHAQDIDHIEHALHMLKPGGRLVAICAGGPRQQDKLRPIVAQYGGTWEELPPETFEEAGTGVRTVLLSVTKPSA